MKMILRRKIGINDHETPLCYKERIGTWRSNFHYNFSHSLSTISQRRLINTITKHRHVIAFKSSVNTSYLENSECFSWQFYSKKRR